MVLLYTEPIIGPEMAYQPKLGEFPDRIWLVWLLGCNSCALWSIGYVEIPPDL